MVIGENLKQTEHYESYYTNMVWVGHNERCQIFKIEIHGIKRT
jgi:hypothetical protein